MPSTPTDLQLPTGLPVVPGLAVSARYVLTSTPPSNRGDTLDVVALPGGRVGLMVADVVGHGFPAAIAAAQSRAVVRERLAAGDPPSEVVRALHRLAGQLPELASATAAVVVLDLAAGTMEAAGAGHPPPLWWDATRGPGPLTDSWGRPLGSPGPVAVGRRPLRSSTGLLLHTDGWTRPDVAGTALRRAVAAADGPGGVRDALDAALERMLADTPGTALRDDAAVLMVQQVTPVPDLVIEAPAIGGHLGQVRAGVERWLTAVGAGLAEQVALVHAVQELGQNVVDHAYRGPGLQARPRVLRVHAALDEVGLLRLTVADRGTWRDPGAGSGNGLVLVGALTDDLRVRRTAVGTEVELTLSLRRPVLLYRSTPVVTGPSGASEPLAIAPGARGEGLDAVVEAGRMAVSGVVDDVSADDFDAALQRVTGAGTRGAVVDLTHVRLLGSPGVAALLATRRRCRRSGSDLRLVARPGCPAARVLAAIDVATHAHAAPSD